MKIIYFYAEWCNTCNDMNSNLDSLRAKLGKDFDVDRIDVDKDVDSAIAYDIRTVPTVVILDNDAIVKKRAGYINLEKLTSMIEKL